MATQVQNRRGTTAEHSTFTGANGELTVDTTKKTVVVHDGSTAGGRSLLREDQSNLPTSAPTTGIYNASGSLGVATNGTGRLFIDASGNVGFGTTSPERPIHLPDGSVLLLGTTAATGTQIAHSASSNLTINNKEAGAQIFYTNDTERLRITSTGQLSFIGAGSSGSPAVGFNGSAPSNSLVITSGGLVGVGTSSPQKALDVYADSGFIVHSTNANSVETPLFIGGGATTQRKLALIGKPVGTWGRQDLLICLNNVEDASEVTSANAVVTLKSTGNVGIGTTSPAYALDVASTDTTAGIGYALRLRQNATAGAAAIQFTDNPVTTQYGYIACDSSSNLKFATGLSERARIDSSGRLLVGTFSARSNYLGGGTAPSFQLEATNFPGSALSLTRNETSGAGAGLLLGRTRGASNGSNTAVIQDDGLGIVSFQGADGTNFIEGARISAAVDGTPGANDMPGRLVFSTTADGTSSPTERMRIDSVGTTTLTCASAAAPFVAKISTTECARFNATGYLKVTSNGSYTSQSGTYNEMYQTANAVTLFARNTDSNLSTTIYYAAAARAANSAYQFFVATSSYGGVADDEFNLRGDGTGLCDGSWTGGGADYAEYFEWADSNPDEEDRRGISVVLDGNKIREAVAGEDPIGVISGNPSVVGDAAWNKWDGKYLRDEYGTYIQEDYEVEDEDGNTVIQQRRKLNPAYNPDVEYISREERPEWDCVGLMGKLRIRKGQITGSRWIKMRDINDSVEEWLVR